MTENTLSSCMCRLERSQCRAGVEESDFIADSFSVLDHYHASMSTRRYDPSEPRKPNLAKPYRFRPSDSTFSGEPTPLSTPTPTLHC